MCKNALRTIFFGQQCTRLQYPNFPGVMPPRPGRSFPGAWNHKTISALLASVPIFPVLRNDITASCCILCCSLQLLTSSAEIVFEQIRWLTCVIIFRFQWITTEMIYKALLVSTPLANAVRGCADRVFIYRKIAEYRFVHASSSRLIL